MWQTFGAIVVAATFVALIQWFILSRTLGAMLAALAAVTGG
jgi:hypothetical protein